MRTVFIAVLCLVGAACTTAPEMAPQECASADWRSLGYSDGAAGKTQANFSVREQICLNAGYDANLTAYNQGHEEGVRIFCQPERAFQLGAGGSSAALTCPPDLEGQFRAALNSGRELYQSRSAWESAESAVRSLFSEREATIRKLNANEVGFDASKTEEERARHRSEILRLRNELSGIDRRIHEQEREAYYKREEFERTRWRLERPVY
jgi:hypothetical protein